MDELKRCGKCKLFKKRDLFNNDKHCKDGKSNRCKACRRLEQFRSHEKHPEKNKNRTKAWRKNNPDKSKESYRNARYSITSEYFQELLLSQNNQCRICCNTFSAELSPNVDHDHSCCPVNSMVCGKCIRGLLCGRCNKAIGFLEDNVQRLLNAVEYLRNNEYTRANARKCSSTICTEPGMGIQSNG
jgi:Recombination endonuclease VII